MASIKKQTNGRYRARYRDRTGKEHARHFQRKIDAQSWLDSQTADLVRGEWVDPSAGRQTFETYARHWQTIQPHRQTTADQVASHLRNHLLPAFGELALADIRPSDVQAFVTRLRAKLSPRTIEVIFTYLSMILSSAVSDGLIVRNPAARRRRGSQGGIQLPKIEEANRKIVPIDVEAAGRLVEAAPPRWRAMVITAIGTGMRQGELLGLTVDRVDFLRRTITVDRQMVTSSAGTDFGPVKTAASNRTIPLPDAVSVALAEHLRIYGTGEDGLIFTTDDGCRVARNRFGDVWRSIRRKADLPAVMFHELRHLYASALIRSGASVKVVQANLGHATAVETLDTYGHLWPDDDDRTRLAIDGLFATEELARAALG